MLLVPKVCVSSRLLQTVMFLTDSVFYVLFAYFDETIDSYQWITPWKSYITVATMPKQNINWFSIVLRVVICFIILTDLTKFSVEVLCGWSVRWSRRSWCEKKEERQELKLGDARGTPSKYSRRLKRLSLGMPRKASPLSSKSIGIFSDSFCSCDMCNLGASFAFSFHFSFMHHAGMR